MSADNGVYILQTLKDSAPGEPVESYGFEYRVIEAMAIENICWEQDDNGEYSDLGTPSMKTVRKYWKDSPILLSRQEALEYADKLLSGCIFCEYGISFIRINEVF